MKKPDTPAAIKPPKVVPNPGRINDEGQPVAGATSGEVNAPTETPAAPTK